MKAVVAALNQEKALVGAFSVIVQLRRYTSHIIYVAVTRPGAAEVRWYIAVNFVYWHS